MKMSRLAWKAVTPALRNPLAQRHLWTWTQQAMCRLGIGSGADSNASGERVALQLLKDSIDSGSPHPLCLFDVGANRGQYVAMLLRGLQGIQKVIHCFEPSQVTFSMLEQACKDYTEVTLNRCGLGEIFGELTLHSDQDGSGLASLTKRNLEHFQIDFIQSETVPIRTLDDYCQEHNIERIDLLKIDVEGHELDVLHGARRMLSESRVRLIQFEFGGCNIDTRTFVRDFWNLFAAIDMQGFFRIMPSGVLFHIDVYSESLEQFRTTNFLVVFDAELLPKAGFLRSAAPLRNKRNLPTSR